MKQLTLDMLEKYEDILEEDVDFKVVRQRIQKALDNNPKSVTLQEALEQVRKSKIKS